MATLGDFTHKYHPHPRMSANQLSEYLTANAPNRRRILQEAKFPSTMIVIRYEDARKTAIAHLAGSESAIENSLASLRRRSSDLALTEYVRQNCDLCIDALDSFQGNLKNFDQKNIIFRRPDLHNTKLKLKNVNVSVSIDLMTERSDRNGDRSIGAAILIFAKPKKGSGIAERCSSTALLIYQLLLMQANTANICDPTLCMAIDVFNGKFYPAKTHHKQLLNALETSCEEIAVRWPSILPPQGYNGPPISMAA